VNVRIQKSAVNSQKMRTKVRMYNHGFEFFSTHFRLLLSSVFCLLTSFSCSKSSQPQAVWMETGTGPNQVVYPRAIAYSPSDDTFFLVDRTAHIQHLDHDGHCLCDWRMPEWKIGKPTGLSVGPDKNLYVADTHYHRVMVYSPQGQLLRRWGKEGQRPGEFIYPTDIAFDAKGDIYVSEYGDNDRISVFDKDINFLYQIGKFGTGDGEFIRPQSMVIDGDTLYVTDACNGRICVFKTDGRWVRNIGHTGGELGEFRFPYGLDMDSNGRLIVCEFGNNRVQMIDKESGKGLRVWGGAGRDLGQMAYPWGVAVDKHDRVAAVDAGNNRVQVFRF
jgi:DNA-binding beta-propeller fold protein YncE